MPDIPNRDADRPSAASVPTRDLRAVRRWITTNTYCVLQEREGWYVKDCIESKARRKCERCKMLVRLDKHLPVKP